jgi:hypothetical protein
MRVSEVLRWLRGAPRLDAFGRPESTVNAERRVEAAAAQRRHDAGAHVAVNPTPESRGS